MASISQLNQALRKHIPLISGSTLNRLNSPKNEFAIHRKDAKLGGRLRYEVLEGRLLIKVRKDAEEQIEKTIHEEIERQCLPYVCPVKPAHYQFFDELNF